jgi:hypothetical protein
MTKIGNYHIFKDIPRMATKFMKKHFKDKWVTGMEIGVEKGLNAKNLLRELNIKALYLIDPNQEWFPSATNIYRFYERSPEALSSIKGKFDFIYVDGDHSYEAVKKDLEASFKLLKRQGVLSGHDIDQIGVTRAVFEFCKGLNKTPVISGLDWWFVK